MSGPGQTAGVTRYLIDSERSTVTARSQPAFRGFTVVVRDLQGELDVDLDRGEVRGTLAAATVVTIGRELTGMGAATRPSGEGTADGDVDERSVRIEVRPAGAELDVDLEIRVDTTTVRTRGTANVAIGRDDSITLSGRLLLDPRAFGIATPAFLNHTLHLAWSLHLMGA